MTYSTATLYKAYMSGARAARIVKFGAGLALLVFGFWTVSFLGIPMDRLFGFFGRLGPMLANRIFPPDLVYATDWKILMSVVETIEMSLLGAFARAVIVICRSFPALILGFLLVAIFVFGPFAGVLALTIGTIGFAGKLMAEQAESIDMGPVEAVRATGAGPLKVFVFGIWPQVKPAWLGFIIYNWDARLRASTILGFVGAGGIGLHLRLQISQLEYHAAMGIITLIIILVIISESISHFLRERLR